MLRRVFSASLILLLGCSDKSLEDSDSPSTDSQTPEETGEETGEDTAVEPVEDGESLYADHCASCHGADGHGTSSGPDLVRELHHTDEELVQVILNGKGDMAAVAITEEQAQMIVSWVRENLQ